MSLKMSAVDMSNLWGNPSRTEPEQRVYNRGAIFEP